MPEPEGGWANLWPLDPQVRFLNHGSFGACPRHVLDYQAQLRQQLERQPVEFLGRRLPGLLDEARRSLAAFLGCAPAELVFVRNATAGVNAVLRSLPLKSEDELVVTDHAYAACRNALDFAAQRSGARVRVASVPFPLESDDQVVQAITNCVTPKTRLVMTDHITSPTALVFPLERLLRELDGVEVLVDGAHAPGMVEINLQRLSPTYHAGTCHKWLCAPTGSGFLYVQQELLGRFKIEVPVDSWTIPSMRLLRLSAQLYNRSEEYDLLAKALKALL